MDLITRCTEHLKKEEGIIPHAYQDHLGYWTIGVGRLIDKRKGGGLSNDEIEFLLKNDILNNCIKQMENWPAWKAIKGDEIRACALVSMCFQLGAVGLSKFNTSLQLIAEKKWFEAGKNLRKSLWAKQTPNRAKRVIAMLETGKEQ